MQKLLNSKEKVDCYGLNAVSDTPFTQRPLPTHTPETAISHALNNERETLVSLVGFSYENEANTEENIKPPCKELSTYYFCYSCGKVHSRLHTCNQRYSRCCYEERRKRNFARLMELPIKSKRLIHIVIGFKKTQSEPTKSHKKIMEKQLQTLHRRIRKTLGYAWCGIRIFDLADNGCYEHFHYAIIPESKFMNGRSLDIDVVSIRKQLKSVTLKQSEIIRVYGFRSKRNLFSYFSKRMAGRYGHKKNVFYLEDIMTYVDYKLQFFNVKSCVLLGNPEGLSRSIAHPRMRCPYCKSFDIEKIITISSTEKFIPNEVIPWLSSVIQQRKIGGFV